MGNMDQRSVTSKENGKKGGRPVKPDMGRVIRVLLRGLKRIAEINLPLGEAVVNFTARKTQAKAALLVAAFEEVMEETRQEYLKNLEKYSKPNPVEAQKDLRAKLDMSARATREYLRLIATKASVLIQDAEEQNIDLGQWRSKLEKLANIEANALDKIVELILGIVSEELDHFGVPIIT